MTLKISKSKNSFLTKKCYSDNIYYDGKSTSVALLNAGLALVGKNWVNPADNSILNVMEFNPDLCIDIHGKSVMPNSIQINWTALTSCISNTNTHNDYCRLIESRLGAPFLEHPSLDYMSLPFVSNDALNQMKAKIFKKIAKEKKDVKEISSLDFVEPQTPKSQGQYDAITLLFSISRDNEPRYRKLVCDYLFDKIVERERDKLFYIRRHPDNPSMHICQDEELLSNIKTIIWAVGLNPFIGKVPCYGLANF